MDYLDWLKKESYELVTEENGVACVNPVWKRATKYGSPKCKINGSIIIRLEKTGDTFEMSVLAFNGTYWVGNTASQIPATTIVRFGRGIEHRLVASWMEMAS